jgi:F-type H+-transporting ATPase subunit a
MSLQDHLPYALRQFETDVLLPIKVFGIDASFTGLSSAKLLTSTLFAAYLIYAARERALVPQRLQASAEWLYTFVADTVLRIVGDEGKPSIPFVFTLFVFVLFGTLLGLTPVKETFTSHLVVTLALSLTVFVYANVIAFRRHGLGFLHFFLPPGVPLFVAPVLIIVELTSYLFRPITLGFRIFANIFAGHVMLKLFADFCTMLITAFGSAGVLFSALPVAAMVILFAFEVVIVCLQSYIFIIITSMYIKDAIHMH